MRISLRNRILSYLKRHPQFIAKGHICDLARSKTGATGEHTGRRLRELAEDGLVEVDYRDGHAWYKYKEPTPQTLTMRI